MKNVNRATIRNRLPGSSLPAYWIKSPNVSLRRRSTRDLAMRMSAGEPPSTTVIQNARQVRSSNSPRTNLILLDLNLPGLSGREVLAEIKGDAALRRIPVLMLSSSRREQDILACYDLHANGCIVKPVDLEQFLEMVRSIEQFWFTAAMLPPGALSSRSLVRADANPAR
jgi:CheY-like chemotaxis protein